jgi:DNA-directed RNA polymerase specialized sigma24 family protein
MAEVGSATRKDRALIDRCLSSDRDAMVEFQHVYGELIYGFPQRVYRTPAEDAGDFYVFAFDNGRIFRRLRTWEGRAPLRAYLLGFVLDDLVLEWKRGMREIDTVSIEAVSELAAPDLSAHHAAGAEGAPAAEQLMLKRLLDDVDPAKALVMKLLHIEDCDLTPADLRQLARISGRRMREVVLGVERLRLIVREREAALKRIEDGLDGVHAWIQLYERRLRRIGDDLSALPPNTTAAVRLREEQVEVAHKIERRHKQRTKLVAQAQRRKVTAPYKEIAALLNTTVGNVASQIARLRQELTAKAGNGKPDTVPQAGECHD